MKRLTKRAKTSHENGVCCTHFLSHECLERAGWCTDNCPWEEAAWSKLAAYEDAEEEGRLVVPPCKVGDTVYHICGMEINEDIVTSIEYYSDHIELWSNDGEWLGILGDIVFLTKTEAEAALEKMKGETLYERYLQSNTLAVYAPTTERGE